jgi:hypothetical protein
VPIWKPMVEAGVMIPPDVRAHEMPLWAVPSPPSLTPVDPASVSDDYDWDALAARALENLRAHEGLDIGVLTATQLPMSPVNVWKHLQKGAELAWQGGKLVVKKGAQHVLGPVGLAGDLYDAYRFLNWVWDKQLPPTPAKVGEPFAGTMPRTHYDISSRKVMFWWPSGQLTDAWLGDISFDG